MRDANRELLVGAARLLKPVLDELVFVGASITGLLITDEAAPTVRVTTDVDAIVAVTSYREYVSFGNRLRDLGFLEDMSEGAPLCRWKHGSLIVDVMPLDEKILGFSNRWYRGATISAQTLTLAPSLDIRAIT